MLDYKSGNLEPWLAKDLKPNAAQDEWTLTLRDGVEWSDSKPGPDGKPDHLFNAADVIFTVQMALDPRISLPANGQKMDESATYR